jgi:hypothetical protein
MRFVYKIPIVPLLGVLCGLTLLGCGSGSSTSEISSSTDPVSVEASREFIEKGGENKIPNFGEEATAQEREAASAVVEASLKARAAADWAAQCATLSKAAAKKIQSFVPPAEGKTCSLALETEASPVEQTQAVRANVMTEPIAALRVKGNKGYALFHGAKGNDYAMAMEKEGDQWKVSALVTVTP